MSWYRTGTVSVAQNSTTVTGAGTAFAANSRVGDGFVGPDGREYEVTNIASDRVLSILPPYKGETVAGGTYAITPIQGYNKATADALRKVSESFVDVTSSVEAAAQSAAAANEDRIAVDLAADKVASDRESAELAAQAAGQHEANAANSADAANQSATVAGQSEAQANQYRQAAADSAAAAAASEGNVSNKVNVSDVQDNLTSTEVAKPLSANQGRILANRVQPALLGGTGNTTGTAARLAAAAMVGTVSQTSGVPTGAIIEQGANANGRYVRFADGTQICWTRRGSSTGNFYSIALGNGTIYGSDAFNSAFAMPFVGIPTVTCSLVTNQAQSELCVASMYAAPTETSFGSWRLITATPNATIAVGFYINLVAVGRWY
ncbi:hypothetical protein NLO95_07730 [Pseudomonas syringae]|nr:hypothetical protein [Pseudomonas syringae]